MSYWCRFLSAINPAPRSVQRWLCPVPLTISLDLILMAITSQASLSNRMGDVSIRDWQAAGLLKASIVKPVMMTIERSLIIQTLGQLSSADAHALTQSITQILGPT
jgi:hypothetical protein